MNPSLNLIAVAVLIELRAASMRLRAVLLRVLQTIELGVEVLRDSR